MGMATPLDSRHDIWCGTKDAAYLGRNDFTLTVRTSV